MFSQNLTMAEPSFLDELKQLFFLYRARRNLAHSRLARSRAHLTKALSYGEQSESYLLALVLDGRLKIGEDRLPEARQSFSRCLALSDASNSTYSKHVGPYCTLWLALYDESLGLEELKDIEAKTRTSLADASMYVRQNLILPREGKIDEIFAHRKLKFDTKSPAQVGVQFEF